MWTKVTATDVLINQKCNKFKEKKKLTPTPPHSERPWHTSLNFLPAKFTLEQESFELERFL